MASQNRKKREVTYVIKVSCYTDFMEKLCDGGFKIALYYLNKYFEEKGYTRTKMEYKKLNKEEASNINYYKNETLD